jgi:serine/threonine protein kinase
MVSLLCSKSTKLWSLLELQIGLWETSSKLTGKQTNGFNRLLRLRGVDAPDDHQIVVKPWELEWEIVEDSDASRGAQGTIRRVRRKTDGVVGALKELHEGNEGQGNAERRARLANEVKALELIGGMGVPRVLAHNIEDVQDKSIPMFFVAEWINGNTLTNYVNGRARPLVEALEITKELSNIVARCHKAGVGHRDIKPDNIIRESESGRVYLVDFGISWTNEDAETEFKTELGSELGNRFLRVPDLAAGSDRRDLRIDLVFLVGILFYVLSGKAPRQLADKFLRPPHIAMSEAISEIVKAREAGSELKQFFDVGFQFSVDQRFQSAGEIISSLEGMISPVKDRVEANDPDSEVTALREMLRSRIDQTVLLIEDAWQGHSMELMGTLKNLARQGEFEFEMSAFATASTGKYVDVRFRLGKRYPIRVDVFLDHRIRFEGEASTYAEALYRITDGAQSVDDQATDYSQYYKDHAANTDGLRDEINRKAPEMMALLVRALREKMERRLDAMGGSE